MSPTIGGVYNTGNSCFLSAVLQELAAFPQHYKPLFEPRFRGGALCRLQVQLSAAVRSIQEGQTVSATQVRCIQDLLRVNGWSEERSEGLRGILQKAFPKQFPSPPQSPFLLYDSICALFNWKIFKDGNLQNGFYRSVLDISDAPFPVLLIDDFVSDPGSYSVEARLQSLGPLPEGTLVKIRLPVGSSCTAQERIEGFALAAIFYSPRAQHIATQLKVTEGWILIDDTQVKGIERPNTLHSTQLLFTKII